jgi:prevent-host-death family protein
MVELENTWTMQQFRDSFEKVVAAATKGPQLITSRGVPVYVVVPATKTATRKAKAEEMVVLHKLKRPANT